jgi:hypothetical protein
MTSPALTLFNDEPPTAVPPTPRPAERPEPVYGLRPAPARLIAAHTGDPHHPDNQPKLYLVVTCCPYCDHQHVHPAGHTGEPRLCVRNSRCIGQTNGAYYFPAVHQ